MGGFRHRSFLQFDERDDGAVVGREAQEGGFEPFARGVPEILVREIAGAREVGFGLDFGHFGVVEVGKEAVAAAIFPAPEIHGGVAGDAEDPDAERSVAAVGAQGSESADECVLGDFLDVLGGQAAGEIGGHEALEGFDDGRERFDVAFQDAPDGFEDEGFVWMALGRFAHGPDGGRAADGTTFSQNGGFRKASFALERQNDGETGRNGAANGGGRGRRGRMAKHGRWGGRGVAIERRGRGIVDGRGRSPVVEMAVVGRGGRAMERTLGAFEAWAGFRMGGAAAAPRFGGRGTQRGGEKGGEGGGEDPAGGVGIHFRSPLNGLVGVST